MTARVRPLEVQHPSMLHLAATLREQGPEAAKRDAALAANLKEIGNG